LQELEAQKLRVTTDIKTVYYDSVRIQQQLSAIEQFSTLLKQGVDAAQKRMQAGEGSKIDLLQTQVQLKQLELDRRQLRASLDARLREIVALAGAPNMQLQGVTGELPETPVDQDWKAIEDGLVSSSPEYAAAQARIRQATAAIRRHESQPLPNLGVQFGAGVDNGTNSGMMNVQVGAPIPVFNKNQGNIAAARAEYCRAIQEAQRIDNAIRARLAVASGEYTRAAEAVKMYLNELLPAAQETLDLAEKAYKAGEQDFIQLLVTRRTYFDTNLAYIAARAQLATAQAQIDGYLLTGALSAVINNSGDASLRDLTLGQE
jgi:cobalt-zinc-cadmium efflux system outer membrane protein